MNLQMTNTKYGMTMGFPHSSVGKESACSAGDPDSVPGLGRSNGERIGYPLLYSCASLVAQLVKNLPAMQETCVWSLGWEDLLQKGILQCSGLENSVACIVHGIPKSRTWLSNFHFHSLPLSIQNKLLRKLKVPVNKRIKTHIFPEKYFYDL